MRVNESVSTEVLSRALITMDTISSPGAQLINNTFTTTHCNLGRFKSSGGAMINNTFQTARIPNLEVTPLPQFFEGPIGIHNIAIQGNTITGAGKDPIHCGPLCEKPGCIEPPACTACPDCTQATPWTTGIYLSGNQITP